MYGEMDINVYQVLSTQQKDGAETPQAGFIIVVFCAANLRSCGRAHSSSRGNVSVVFISGVKFSCTSNLREGYLPVCVWRGGEMETLSRLPFSSQLQSSNHPQLFGLWAPSPTSLPTLARMGRIKTSQPKSVILWIWGTQMFPEGAVWPLPTFWELFRWGRPLKWAGPERYKDIISIMQMSGNVPSLGMGWAAVLSSLSLFPPPQVRRHPKIPEVFQHCTRRLPFHICSLDCPEEKIPEGPKTFGAYSLVASRTGPSLLAAGKSFSLRKS